MALFKLGSTVTECRGKLGGSAFQMNAGRCFAFNKSHPSNVVTRYNVSNKFVRNTLALKWKTLTAAQRLLWNNFAVTAFAKNYYAHSKNWSGFNWYLSCNSFIALTGYAALLTIPPPVGSYTKAAVMTGYSIPAIGGNVIINFSPTPPASYGYVFYASKPLAKSRKAFKSMYGFITFAVNSTAYNMASAYGSRYPYTKYTGQIIYFKMVPFYFATGLYGRPSVMKCVVS